MNPCLVLRLSVRDVNRAWRTHAAAPCILVIDVIVLKWRDRPFLLGWMRPYESLGRRAALPSRTRTVAGADNEPVSARPGRPGSREDRADGHARERRSDGAQLRRHRREQSRA